MLIVVAMLLSAFSQDRSLPLAVSDCVRRNSGVTMNVLQQPPYLKVFFTREPEPDYAVVVKQQGSDLNRVLVCMHDGRQVILGSKSDQQPFSDMPNDNYLSSNWRVCSKKSVRVLRRYYSGVPDPDNESICLLWEDGEALIYLDAGKFRWKSLTP
jgi:hypothetical protein